MKKYIMTMMILVVSASLLMACGKESDVNNESDETEAANDTGDNDSEDQVAIINIPDEVISNGDADPIELEDQMGLELGDEGYVITQSDGLPLAVTLNSV